MTTTTQTLGSSSLRCGTVYANAALNTSDISLKKDFSEIPAALLEAWSKVSYGTFRWKSSPDKIQIGLIAQDIVNAFASVNIDAHEYGIVELGDDGLYSVNYTHVQCLEAAYIRYKLNL